jgi:L-threonylcarbamoyladenylate synthase
MQMLTDSDADITIAADALRRGQLVAFPTETVYGLGGNARDPHAVAGIFAAKKRPDFDPLIVHVATVKEADLVGDMQNAYAQTLSDAFWPGPLTMVLPKREWVPGIVTSGLSTVAVRCPSHELARTIIGRSGVPVAAPSANLFGRLSPTSAGHVAEGLGESIDFIVDGGSCLFGVESTVVDLSMDPPMVLRPGGVDIESLQSLIPSLQVFDRSTTSPRAPGQLPDHYAPVKPLRLFRAKTLADAISTGRAAPDERIAALCFGADTAMELKSTRFFSIVADLSPSGDLLEAAAGLFGALHELEFSDCTRIWAERLPDRGIGKAVNDRLYKASVK